MIQETPYPTDRQPALRTLAMPADTNPHGHIFGGWIMSQMDIAGGTVAVNYANTRVATVAVTSMEFHHPVFVGDLVSCFAEIVRVGRTSITTKVEVFAQRGQSSGQPSCIKVTEAIMIFVALDAQGQKVQLPPLPSKLS